MIESPANMGTLSQELNRRPSRSNGVSKRPAFTKAATISLVIPCYNEADGLPSLRESLLPLIERLRREHHDVELVLVDDGSRDDTYPLLQDLFPASNGLAVKLVRHKENQGLSSALRTAAGVVTGDVVCTLDADCTYSPSEVFGLLEMMDRTGADVVTGSPYHPDGGVENVQGWRLALSRGASQMYGVIVRQKLYCYTSMFRAYSREWFRAELITTNHFIGVTEILIRSILAGAHVVEYPVVLRRRVYGESKLRVGRATWQHLKFMGRILIVPKNGVTKVS
jgi:dolichol-phosphate mannosyltransferase